MTDKPTPEDIKERIISIIRRGYDEIYSNLDQLHKRDIHDDDVVKALRDLHEMDILDGYADWAEIDLREDDNTTTDPTVPDPMNAASYDGLNEALKGLTVGITERQLQALRDALPLGTKVAYGSKDPNGMKVRAFTTSKVFVSGGVPVVALSTGEAASLNHIEVDQ